MFLKFVYLLKAWKFTNDTFYTQHLTYLQFVVILSNYWNWEIIHIKYLLESHFLLQKLKTA